MWVVATGGVLCFMMFLPNIMTKIYSRFLFKEMPSITDQQFRYVVVMFESR